MLEKIKNTVETIYLRRLAKFAASEELDGWKLPRYVSVVSNGGEKKVFSCSRFESYEEAYMAARVAEREIGHDKRIEITITKG